MNYIVLLFIIYAVIKYKQTQKKAKAAKETIRRKQERRMHRTEGVVADAETVDGEEVVRGDSLSDLVDSLSEQWSAGQLSDEELLKELEENVGAANGNSGSFYVEDDERVKTYEWEDTLSDRVGEEAWVQEQDEEGREAVPLDSTESIEFAAGDRLKELRTEVSDGEKWAYSLKEQPTVAKSFDARQAMVYSTIMQRWRPYGRRGRSDF
ncbi:MAG: hypothetical protein CSA97_04190 [Bacteroidetes bacterium]|nr:MAG: hypothetical protein CSA97_04190 [Bacteroidota bacterium]